MHCGFCGLSLFLSPTLRYTLQEAAWMGTKNGQNLPLLLLFLRLPLRLKHTQTRTIVVCVVAWILMYIRVIFER